MRNKFSSIVEECDEDNKRKKMEQISIAVMHRHKALTMWKSGSTKQTQANDFHVVGTILEKTNDDDNNNVYNSLFYHCFHMCCAAHSL